MHEARQERTSHEASEDSPQTAEQAQAAAESAQAAAETAQQQAEAHRDDCIANMEAAQQDLADKTAEMTEKAREDDATIRTLEADLDRMVTTNPATLWLPSLAVALALSVFPTGRQWSNTCVALSRTLSE